MQLIVDNEPLNTVLNMLGIEISFDHDALSKYRMSLSKSFENPEDALFYLLENKPFRIEKIKNVYIIVPEEQKNTSFPENSQKRTHLSPPPKKPVAFPLYGAEIQLKEVTITEDSLQQNGNRTIYQITSLFSEGAVNAQELLNKIPELYFDKVLNRILTSDNHENILLLVNNIPQSSDYIKQLSPYRIQSIEIIHGMPGRFLSEDYSLVVNFILKKNYTGYDIYVSNFAAVHPAGNENGLLTVEQPVAGMTYTNRHLSIYGIYSFSREGWEIPASKELHYGNIELASEKAATTAPNNLYGRQNNSLAGGINYLLTSNQLMGIQGEYNYGNTRTNQIYVMNEKNIPNGRNRIFSNRTNNRTKAQSFVGTLFYEGKITGRFQIYGDFSYNFYYNDIENEYNRNDSWNYRNGNLYNEYKNHTLLNMEGQYRLSEFVTSTFGYAHIWRKYASGSSHGKGFLDYGEYRNKTFLYFLLNPPDIPATSKFGVTVEHVRIINRNSKKTHFRLFPYLQAGYKLNPDWNINLSYISNQEYPSLYQLSPMTMVIDSFLTQIGNPDLKSAIKHNTSVRLSFRDRFIFIPSLIYTYDGISEEYLMEEYKLYKTFNNIHTREYNLHLIYEQPLGKHFHWKNRLTYYRGEALYDNLENSVNGWLFNSEMDYYCPEKSLGLQLGYYRNMKKNILWQGYQMSDKDNWLITASREFWNKQLSIRLSYLPPVSWGIRNEQRKEMDTSLYREKTVLNLRAYNHILFLRINFRFDHGSFKPSGRYTPVEKEEREKQTIELQ
ncbi:MAG: outer membrane beta-barrel protein [Candidatus Symbiothrix sp.]|jgi:hypothetical protein|nr:outer membrane beta-barrel protein [Candidatus Symbiothrix sp.]